MNLSTPSLMLTPVLPRIICWMMMKLVLHHLTPTMLLTLPHHHPHLLHLPLPLLNPLPGSYMIDHVSMHPRDWILPILGHTDDVSTLPMNPSETKCMPCWQLGIQTTNQVTSLMILRTP